MGKKLEARILIVDDNEEVLVALELYLSSFFANIYTEKNPNLLPSLLERENFDVILLDMNFSAGISSGNEGIYWMQEILKIDPLAAIIFITAYGDIQLAVKAIRMGAVDFITKPWENEKMLATIQSALELRKSRMEISSLRNKQRYLARDIDRKFQFFPGQSDLMKHIFEMIDKVASTDANVLILGENGTGKELVAREIHRLSHRSDEVFITVDMGSFPETLFESELFGHMKGSFTNALDDKAGRMELANGGTLFLDEIGNLPFALQSKILATLQNREIFRIGSTKSIPVNFRLISATNQSLYAMVEEKQFREDLLYRINTIQLEIPPLRERKEDILGLAEFFLEKYGGKYEKINLKLHSSARDKLQKHSWPGNIRELEHIIEKAVILADKNLIYADDIQFYANKKKTASVNRKVSNLQENEKIIIAEVLRDCYGNMSESADKLGITRATLYRKIRKYEL